jgi:hypothetical protein
MRGRAMTGMRKGWLERHFATREARAGLLKWFVILSFAFLGVGYAVMAWIYLHGHL